MNRPPSPPLFWHASHARNLRGCLQWHNRTVRGRPPKNDNCRIPEDGISFYAGLVKPPRSSGGSLESSQEPAPYPRKPYWTTAKIIALILVVILVVSVSGFAAFNYLQNSPLRTSSNTCSNGATNYPACDICPSGKTYYQFKCYGGDFEISATPFPSSTPVGTVIQSTVTVSPTNGFSGSPTIGWTGSGISVCDIRLPPLVASNTAIITCGGEIAFSNPPPGYYSLTVTGTFGSLSHSINLSFSFFTPTCSNGATNYPNCTTFRTTTSVTCTPTTIMSHQLISSSCTVTVTATVAAPPTGTVDFTASYSWYASSCYQGSTSACQLTPLSGGYSSQFTLTGVSVQENKGSLTVYAHYNGDNSHLPSDGQFVLTVVSPPATVNVSGTASVSSGNTPYDIQFTNASGVGFITAVNSGGSSSGSYNINLPNLGTYAITIFYSSIFGPKTCTVGTYLYLQSTTGTLIANYSC